MATYTSSQVTNGKVRMVESGLQHYAVGPINTNGTTLSVGDVFQAVPIPHGAVVTNIYVSGNVPGVAGVGFSVGDGVSTARYGTVSLSSTGQYVRAPMGSITGPFKYSLSDDATTRWDSIDLVVATASSATVTANIYVGVDYYMSPT